MSNRLFSHLVRFRRTYSYGLSLAVTAAGLAVPTIALAATVGPSPSEVLAVREHPTIMTTISRVNGVYFVDKATLTGTSGTVTGTVAFFLCAQVGLFNGCPPDLGVPISSPKLLVSGSATSNPSPLNLAPGRYCIGVEYRNDGRSPYLDTVYSSPAASECFTDLP